MIVRWFFEFCFKLFVSSSDYFIEYPIYLEHKRENMSFSLSNARERLPTCAASGKHGCMLARSLDLHPTETNPTQARNSTSSVSALWSSARLPWSACMSRSFRRTTYVANASRACVRCCFALFSSVCWTECARACGARAGTGRFIAHARVFRNVHSPIYNTHHDQ